MAESVDVLQKNGSFINQVIAELAFGAFPFETLATFAKVTLGSESPVSLSIFYIKTTVRRIVQKLKEIVNTYCVHISKLIGDVTG